MLDTGLALGDVACDAIQVLGALTIAGVLVIYFGTFFGAWGDR